MVKLAIKGGPRTVPEGSIKPQPWITEEEKKAVLKAVETPRPQSFEIVKEVAAEWARYVNVKHCLLTSSGTAALHMAVAAAGVEPGDEVITSAFTYHASASCILHHNGVPVFVDIDSNTLNINPDKIEEKITDRTKAIIPVHLHGIPADMEKINAIAKKHDLVVIEDASHAHGAEYKGKKAGALGDMAGFSLQSNKVITSHGGGIFTTDSDEYAEKAIGARGMGWSYLMSPLSAAFLDGQIKNIEENLAIRRKNCEYLTSHLNKIDGVRPVKVPPEAKSAWWLYPVRFTPQDLDVNLSPRKFRIAMEEILNAEGVPIRQWQRMPTPLDNRFRLKHGYGKGCPWSCPHASAKGVEYRAQDYPETLKVLDDYSTISGIWPPNGLELMEYYIAAFEKAFENLDAVIELASKIEDQKFKVPVIYGV